MASLDLCPVCRGNGMSVVYPGRVCPACAGSGRIPGPCTPPGATCSTPWPPPAPLARLWRVE